RILDPDAAGAKGTALAIEQIAVGGVVKIDQIIVWEHELDPPEGVVRPRPLHESVCKALADPIDARRIYPFALAIEHLDVAGGEIAGVAPDLRKNIPAEDVRRHRPGGVEHEVAQRGLEHRSAAVREADLHTRAP